MTVKQKTCAQRIDQEWEDRRNMIGDFAFAVGGVHWDCDFNDDINEATGEEYDNLCNFCADDIAEEFELELGY